MAQRRISLPLVSTLILLSLAVVAAEADAFSWVAGPYGTCSVTCGAGTQTRTVVCVDDLGTPVPDFNCPGPKPVTIQSCNTQVCSPSVPALGPLTRALLAIVLTSAGGLAWHRRYS